jgi:uncharacterized protein YdeI (YjbR/CyaY-like superfamily)
VNRDPRIDCYIERAAPFAQPILRHVRERVHAIAPQAEETLKWSMPSFTLNGRILVTMAAFKAHASVGFWRGEELGLERKSEGMGQLGRLTSIDDLPDDLDALIGKAAELTKAAPAPRKTKPAPKPAAEIHPDFAAALETNPAARRTLDAFPPSCRREYVDWIAEATREETRRKRIDTALEWLAQGKKRHWKYEDC